MSIETKIRVLASKYAMALNEKIETRVQEMQQDDQSHYLIYRVLGIGLVEGQKIDQYQNTGRLLYNSAGRFLEEATKLCFKTTFPESGTVKVPNTRGQKPKTFEIDCLVENQAIEIKWRDATTDGDHISKEHVRLQVIAEHGFIPVRIMFYYPNRDQAIKIQETLQTLYRGLDGSYYFADAAWQFVQTRTGIDLKAILEQIVEES